MSVDPEDFKPYVYCSQCGRKILDTFDAWATPFCDECADEKEPEWGPGGSIPRGETALEKAERERGEADEALAACRAEAGGRISALKEALARLIKAEDDFEAESGVKMDDPVADAVRLARPLLAKDGGL